MEASEFLKSLKKNKRLLIWLLVMQHILFLYGGYRLIQGDVILGLFHIILNGVMIPVNFRTIKRNKKTMELVKSTEEMKLRFRDKYERLKGKNEESTSRS